MQDSRSQLENKTISETLKRKGNGTAYFADAAQNAGDRSNHMQVQRGNPIRTYSGTDFKRIIRINPLKTKAIPEK